MSTTNNETRVNLGKVPVLGKDGKTQATDEKTGEPLFETLENITEKKANEVIAEYKTLGFAEPEVTKIQTFQYTEVDGDSLDAILADFKAVIEQYQPDATKATAVAKSVINRGVVLAQQKVGREFMTDAEQGAVEGVFNLATEAFVPGEGRRKADPRSAAAKNLSALVGRPVTVDEVDSILAMFGGAMPGQQAQVGA